MTIVDSPSPIDALTDYLGDERIAPLFIVGDAQTTLRSFPDQSIDCCITSPPYWGKRYYDTPGIGNETTWQEYIDHLLSVCAEIRRVLKPTGSFWLNLGDTYHQKSLAGIPWRVALRLIDEQGWLLRNDVIWHKIKGGLDTTRDRLRNVHEYLFHFVKIANGYYYDIDAIRHRPRSARIVDGAVVSATGVRGVRYRRQIELSTVLNEEEKAHALRELDRMLEQLQTGAIADFRMIIRGQQRPTHSDSTKVSGRARELQERGFYFLVYHPNGSKPGDVWDILPEDTQARQPHFAPYPADLCKIPILATCPLGGTVLDPFCGTGTTMLVAQELDRKSIGIDISPAYIRLAEDRCRRLL